MIAAVIGGANGIGLEIARQMTSRGAKVAIGDRDGDAAIRAAAAIGGHATGIRVDVTNPASIEAFLAEIESSWGTVDVLVNSAGVMWVGAYDSEPESATHAQIDVNLLGVIHTVKAVAPRMRARGSGHILVIASAAVPPSHTGRGDVCGKQTRRVRVPEGRSSGASRNRSEDLSHHAHRCRDGPGGRNLVRLRCALEARGRRPCRGAHD